MVSNVFEELSPALSEDRALLEADRCLECGGPHAPAPRSVACPAGIAGSLEHVQQRVDDEWARLLERSSASSDDAIRIGSKYAVRSDLPHR